MPKLKKESVLFHSWFELVMASCLENCLRPQYDYSVASRKGQDTAKTGKKPPT